MIRVWVNNTNFRVPVWNWLWLGAFIFFHLEARMSATSSSAADYEGPLFKLLAQRRLPASTPPTAPTSLVCSVIFFRHGARGPAWISDLLPPVRLLVFMLYHPWLLSLILVVASAFVLAPLYDNSFTTTTLCTFYTRRLSCNSETFPEGFALNFCHFLNTSANLINRRCRSPAGWMWPQATCWFGRPRGARVCTSLLVSHATRCWHHSLARPARSSERCSRGAFHHLQQHFYGVSTHLLNFLISLKKRITLR